MDKLTFENYKSFKNKQELELKPLTILIGKNSSGKSSIAKLPPLIENSLTGTFPEPLLFNNSGVELGAEFKDLIFGQVTTGAKALSFGLYDGSDSLEIKIVQVNPVNDSYGIFEWKLNSSGTLKEGNDTDAYRGFLLQETECQMPEHFSLRTDYIGPFRKLPERSYSRHVNYGTNKFGIHGENAYSFLIQDSLLDNSLVTKVSEWYEKNFSGWKVSVNNEKAPFYQIELSRGSGEVGINIKDVGQGMSQALPLVTRAMKPAEEESLIILEQPELHLHPAAHANLAELFVQSTIEDSNKKYLIETHSQNFILRLRYLIAEGILDHEKLKLYFIDFDEDRGTSELISIDVDENGDVSYWPEGVFNESFEETRAIIRAQQKN